jgi:hypothetical protein
VQSEAPIQLGIVDLYDNVWPGARTELVQAPSVVDDAEATAANEPPEKQT